MFYATAFWCIIHQSGPLSLLNIPKMTSYHVNFSLHVFSSLKTVSASEWDNAKNNTSDNNINTNNMVVVGSNSMRKVSLDSVATTIDSEQQ